MKSIARAAVLTGLVFLAAGCAESSKSARVEMCVESTKFGAIVGDATAAEMWDAAGQSDDVLRVACDDLAASDPERLTTMVAEWEVTLRVIRDASPTATDRRCDPSYPAMCIRLDEPDLDCSNVGASGFPVAPPDRHGFDTDGDGFGCVPGADTG